MFKMQQPQTYNQFAVFVFKSVGFIDYTQTPRNFPQFLAISNDHFKRRDEDVELVDIFQSLSFAALKKEFVFLEHCSTGIGAVVHNHVQVGPRFELTVPVENS